MCHHAAAIEHRYRACSAQQKGEVGRSGARFDVNIEFQARPVAAKAQVDSPGNLLIANHCKCADVRPPALFVFTAIVMNPKRKGSLAAQVRPSVEFEADWRLRSQR